MSKWINCPSCGLLRPPDEEIAECACGRKSTNMDIEYWHFNADDADGFAGPFNTLEEAKVDALEYAEDRAYRFPKIKIAKVVAVSSTKVTCETTWEDTWKD